MWRLRNVCLISLLILVTTSAYSAPQYSPRPFSTTVVKDYIASCKIHPVGCSLEMGNALINKIELHGPAQVCLVSGYDEHVIFDWLVSHPDAQQMPTQDGIYLAMKSLYPCR
jgi:hypothetical protein